MRVGLGQGREPGERGRSGAAGPLGPITVFGDSVLLGSILVGPTIGEQLAARGWGPIRSRAGEGYSTGAFNSRADWKATTWLDSWRREGWDAPNVLINLGAVVVNVVTPASRTAPSGSRLSVRRPPVR